MAFLFNIFSEVQHLSNQYVFLQKDKRAFGCLQKGKPALSCLRLNFVSFDIRVFLDTILNTKLFSIGLFFGQLFLRQLLLVDSFSFYQVEIE